MHLSTEKEESLSEFFAEDYILPKLGYHKGRVFAFSPQWPMIQKTDSAGNSIKEMKLKICDIKRNTNKRMKRRDAVIQKQIDCIKIQQRTIEHHKQKLLGSDSQIKKLRAKLDRINHCAAYWKKGFRMSIILLKAKRKSLLKKEVSALAFDNSELRDTIQTILSSEPKITTFENNKYTDDVHACVETLQTDGTTKFGEHFTTYDVKTESLSYTLGLWHVFSGSSSDILETLKEILNDMIEFNYY